MEGFNEQVVKRVNKAKQLVIKIISVVVLIMIPFIGAGLAIMTHIQYIFMISIFLFMGGIYGVWYVVGFDIKSDKQAVITIANELGSEDQKLTLTQNSDSTYQLKFLGYNAVKRAQGKKLVKIPSELKMEKKR